MILGDMATKQIVHIDFLASVPITVPVMLISIVVSLTATKNGLGKFLDKKILKKITSVALSYLIAISIAIIRIDNLVGYGIEIFFLSSILLSAVTLYIMLFGKRWFHQDWFENAIGIFGLATGVLSTGFFLINEADPENRTGAEANLALGNTLSTFTTQSFLLTFFPLIFLKNWKLSYMIVGFGVLFFTSAGCFLFKKSKH